MGVPDTTLLDLIDKVRYLAPWGATELSVFDMVDENMLCGECGVKFTELCQKYCCQGCRRLLCGLCVRTSGSLVIIATYNGSNDIDHLHKVIKACKLCSKASKRHDKKIYPSESPRVNPEAPLPQIGGENMNDEKTNVTEDECVPGTIEFQEDNLLPHVFAGHRSQSSHWLSPSQSDEELEESGRHFFSSSSEHYHDSSDIDNTVSFRHECYSFESGASSPSGSPSRFNISTPRAGFSVQLQKGGSSEPQRNSPSRRETMAVLKMPDKETVVPENGFSQSGESITIRQNKKYVMPMDFENNVDIWFPPPPEDEEDEAENNYFEYYDDDDDDDDDENDDGVGASVGVFSSSSSLTDLFPAKEKHVELKEPLNAVIQGHFRALVSQLLQGQCIKTGKENGGQDWLDIVSTLAWQAAKFVRPDTSKGGSMDPVNYVKIKCVASGNPSASALVKGVVCTKNIKHKRMASLYKNPRLLLLGGSLEYQRSQNQLASFNTLLEEEMNHLKVIVSKIEAHRTNVLLVEKSVSSYALEYLLAKDISLVLNVKRPLLERIERCTGASITPVNNIPAARLGHCKLFRLEKVSEELENLNQFNRRPSKTLMYIEGCSRRLGCTVVLKGSCREELKKIKHVVQYAIFAAHHLSLETSFLADEGALLPKMTSKPSYSFSNDITTESDVSTLCTSEIVTPSQELEGFVDPPDGVIINLDDGSSEPTAPCLNYAIIHPVDAKTDETSTQGSLDVSACNTVELASHLPNRSLLGLTVCPSGVIDSEQSKLIETVSPVERQPREMDDHEVGKGYFAATKNQQSILVSFSSRCVQKGTLCERSRLMRFRFYGSFDKPLGKYLVDDLFNQVSICHTCKEPVEAHVQCYTHRQGSLTINVRRLDTTKLPGERDGKIWMWHRCLRCAQIDGVPPATCRVTMSDAAWGLSFGKFLELSFSNHATANRVASCGHSLQRDCLRFYGFGSMVAFFHYSPIDILSVCLPLTMLEYDGHSKREWIRREVEELNSKMETLYGEIRDVLHIMDQKGISLGNGSSDSSDLHEHIQELKVLLDMERDEYHGLLRQASEENSELIGRAFDILELNRLRRSLLIASRAWNHQLYSLESLLNSKHFSFEVSEGNGSHADLRELNHDSIEDSKFGTDQAEKTLGHAESNFTEHSFSNFCQPLQQENIHMDEETIVTEKCSESTQSPASNLSDKIDSAWTGTGVEASQSALVTEIIRADKVPLKRLVAPVRVYSFDSALRMQEKFQRGLLSSHLSAARSFHASGENRSMVRDPTSNVMRHYFQVPLETNFGHSFILSVSQMSEGPRLLLPQAGKNDLVIAVYDDEPTSLISYALSSKEYVDWTSNQLSQHDDCKSMIREDSTTSTFLSWQSFGSLELDYMSYGSEDASLRNSMPSVPKKSPHFHLCFDDDSSFGGGKVKFSVTCYFAKQFDMLRKKCCRSEVDFVCSLSRCRRWNAQGGKSNVYFAKSLDERFIIKQVTKTELESFEDFAPEYFKYLNESVDSGSPTCLAKILGIFQVCIKHLKGGRETKMDLMVMENLFFKRSISRIYDLKGSLRSRYNPDATGANKVLLDMNLLEMLRTNPIFLGSKAKRRLERAVWNDTSFLASVDVMDYSLLVGVDEERKELVLGIIDFMRQYTWDKHLETWVKASGILGGLSNASPTIISPKQYKKRFRKAMTSYFLTVPDQWPS